MWDFIVKYIKGFRAFLANFTTTINSNITFGINVDIIYFLSILVIIGYVVYIFVKYWNNIPDRQSLFIRLFSSAFITVIFVGIIWKTISDVSSTTIVVLPTEWFIADDNNMDNQELTLKLDYYWINTKLDNLYKIPLTTKDWEKKILYYTIYLPNNSLTIKDSRKIEVVSVNNYTTVWWSLNVIKWNIKIAGYDKASSKATLVVQLDELNKKQVFQVYAIKNALWDYVIKDGIILDKILKTSNQATNLYIVKIWDTLYFNPYLIYRIAIDRGTLMAIRETLGNRFPFLFFQLDNVNKSYFIYDDGDYFTVTFLPKSFLSKFLTKYQWSSMFGTKDEFDNKRIIIESYINSNDYGIWTLILSFFYKLFVYLIWLIAYILYVFVPYLAFYLLDNLVKPEEI